MINLRNYQPPPPLFLKALGWTILKTAGWRIENGLPPASEVPRYVAIAAPHTSNWDAPLFLSAAILCGARPVFTVKKEAFRFPWGAPLRYLGCYPIDRSTSHNVVDQVVDLFAEADTLVFGVTPEGTRRRTEYWRSGFYHIAHRANVPILLGFLDYRRKVVGARRELLHPSGDIQADMAEIAAFYATITPHHPEKFGPVRVRPHEKGAAQGEPS